MPLGAPKSPSSRALDSKVHRQVRLPVRQKKGWEVRTADVASVLTDLSAGGTMGLCSQNTIGSAVGSAECGS